MATFNGTAGSDALEGTDDDIFTKTADILNGLGGDDTLYLGTGADTASGGSGNDLIYFNSVLSTNQTLPPGAIDGGTGYDVVDASAVSPVSLTNGTGGPEIRVGSQRYSLTGVEEIRLGTSSTFNDGDTFAGITIRTGAGGNRNFNGGAGDDVLIGGAGHDNLFGSSGNDALNGSAGNDHLYGQSANGGSDGTDSLSGGEGSDYLQGNAGNDLLDGGDGSDRIQGGQGDDNALGAAGNDTINGNLGNDTIDGGVGNDSLRGGQGNDSISGGDGADILSGDLGVDTLAGGLGSDVFNFGGNASLFSGSSADVVADFQDGTDKLQVGYAVQAVLTGTGQSNFSAAATAAQQLFDSRAGNGEVAVVAVGQDSYAFYSSNGGAAADSAVLLSNTSASNISTADFLAV